MDISEQHAYVLHSTDTQVAYALVDSQPFSRFGRPRDTEVMIKACVKKNSDKNVEIEEVELTLGKRIEVGDLAALCAVQNNVSGE